MEQPKLFDTKEFTDDAYIEFYRADGNLICEGCQKKYYDHAWEEDIRGFDGRPYLNRLCNGDLVKL